MAKYNTAYAVLLNNGDSQILPISKAQLIELANSQQGQFGTDVKDVAAALTYLLAQDARNLEAANTYTGEQINLLDSDNVARSGYVLSAIHQVDGKLTNTYTETWLDASVVSYQGGDEAGAPTTVKGAIEDIQEKLADLAGEGEGSVQSQIEAAINDLDAEAMGETGKAITYVSQENGKVSAGTGNIAAQYVNVDNTNLQWDTNSDGTLESDLTVQSAITYLDSQITALETGAARYTIEKKTENLAANVKEQYVLKQTVNGSTTDVQVPINIYKDSQLLAAAVSTADATYSNGNIVAGSDTTNALVLVYSVYKNESWTEEVVHIPVADFFSSLTAGDGLTESNGVINVVPAADSEGFLEVNADSIAIKGVQDAINTAKQNAYTHAEGLINDVDAEVVADNSGTSYVLTGVKLEGDNNTLEFTSYTGVALTDANVKTTFAASDDPIAALVPSDGENPENVKEALDLIASSLSALTGTAPITTITGDDDNTYVKISTNKVGTEVRLEVNDSALGNVAKLQYDELTWNGAETVTILGANPDNN